MSNNYKKLFSPIKIGKLELKNRIALAPMSVHITPPDGSITDREVNFYKRRAQGGPGLIIIGSVLVRADGNFGGQIFIDNDDRISGLKKMTDAIHQAGSKISAQIHHSGRETSIATSGYQPVSASEFEPETPEYDPPRALTTREVQDYVEYYAQGVRRAKEAGFDSVELHGAHGYLIAQFMSPLTNFRTDQYGGSFLGRMRFIKEIFARSRELVGEDFPITVRISGDELRPGGIDMHLAREIAQYLEELGAAALSVSAQMYPYVRTCPNMFHKPGINVYLAENVKEVVSIPVMTAGRINTPELAEEILSSGKADMVCMGRVLLADPDFPKKAQEGKTDEIITCIACNKGCHDRNAEDRAVKCTLNPETGREGTFKITPAKKKKKVMVIGGGPGGMEAARVATLRGHDVDLYDQNNELGGRLILASVPPNKDGYYEAVEYFKREIKRHNIKVHLGVKVDREKIEKEKPDTVILATGASTLMPNIPCEDKTCLVDSDDILAGKKTAGERVVVIGGGAVGAETAHYLMRTAQREVFLLEMLPEIAQDMSTEVRVTFLREIKKEPDLKVLTNTKVVNIGRDSISVERDSEVDIIDSVDTIILATGALPNNELAEDLKDCKIDFYTVGDACEARDATRAIYEGAKAATEI
ncbi:MAG: FAD-dependent oxidoreductase [Candidatus Humimicrobiaceae bacterium]